MHALFYPEEPDSTVVDIESNRSLVLGEIARSTMVYDKDIINISHTNQVKDLCARVSLYDTDTTK